MAYNEDSSASGHDEPWIQWFCGLKGHEMFCEVERAYIEDGFNLYGLRACVSNFSDCLDLILDRIGPDDSDDSHLTQSACTLYGLIHARYIITAHGLDAMYNKYASKEFGACPLVQCNGQPVLPVGLKDEVGVDTVKVFCPKCRCVYHPPPSRSRGGSGAVDGASFGTTFPHLFLMTFNQLIPEPLSAAQIYVPRVFGFRVHQSSRQMDNVLPLTNANVNSFNKLNAASKGGGVGSNVGIGGVASMVGGGGNNNNPIISGMAVNTQNNFIGHPPVSVVACSKAKNLSHVDRQARQDLIRDIQQQQQLPVMDEKPKFQEKVLTKPNPANTAPIKAGSNIDEIILVDNHNISNQQHQQVSTIEAKDPILGEDGKLLKQQQLKRKTKTANEGVQLDNNNNGTLHNNNGIDIANDTSIKSKSKRPKRLGNGIT